MDFTYLEAQKLIFEYSRIGFDRPIFMAELGAHFKFGTLIRKL